MTRYLDADEPLAPPTVRSLLPDYVWSWDRVDLTWEEFNSIPAGPYNARPTDFSEHPGAQYRSPTNRYGERVGAWKLNRVKQTNCGPDGDCTQYEFLLIYIDGKPLIQDFHDDPYYNLALRRQQ